MKKIAVLVFNHIGHHAHYSRLIYDALASDFEVTFVSTPKVLSSDEWASYFSSKEQGYRVQTVKTDEKTAYVNCVKSGNFDYVFAEHFQTYWHKILFQMLLNKCRKKVKCGGIICQTPYAYGENRLSRFKKIHRFLLTKIAVYLYNSLFFIDEIGYGLLFDNPQFFPNCHIIKDPIEDFRTFSKEDFRKKRSFAIDDKILCSIGLMYDKKRIDLLVKAFIDSKPDLNQKLLLAGNFYTGMKSQIQELIKQSEYSGNIILEDRWLEREEVDEYISGSDYVAVTYEDHYANASLLFRACQMNKPVLASADGWIGRYAREHNTGIVVDIHNPEEYAGGVHEIFEGNAFNQNHPLQGHDEQRFLCALRIGIKGGERK